MEAETSAAATAELIETIAKVLEHETESVARAAVTEAEKESVAEAATERTAPR